MASQVAPPQDVWLVELAEQRHLAVTCRQLVVPAALPALQVARVPAQAVYQPAKAAMVAPEPAVTAVAAEAVAVVG